MIHIQPWETFFGGKVTCDSPSTYKLVAGAHRLEACRQLGVTKIWVRVVHLDEFESVIAECDENLCGPKLSPSETAIFTGRRKEAFEALHPETAHGKASPNKEEKFSSFAKDTAEKTGQTDRTVRLHAERGKKVIPEVLDMVRGTKLDTGAYLDRMKRLPPSEQVTLAKRDVTFRKKFDHLDVADIEQKQTAKLLADWEAASPKARADFMRIAKLSPVTAAVPNSYAIASGRAG